MKRMHAHWKTIKHQTFQMCLLLSQNCNPITLWKTALKCAFILPEIYYWYWDTRYVSSVSLLYSKNVPLKVVQQIIVSKEWIILNVTYNLTFSIVYYLQNKNYKHNTKALPTWEVESNISLLLWHVTFNLERK